MRFRGCGWTAAGVGLVSLAMCLAGAIPAFGEEQKCPETDARRSLPNGFCATIFADKIGHARQLAVAPDGTVYVNTWSGVYYNNDTPPEGGFLIALKDTKGTGHADVNVRFGPMPEITRETLPRFRSGWDTPISQRQGSMTQEQNQTRE